MRLTRQFITFSLANFESQLSAQLLMRNFVNNILVPHVVDCGSLRLLMLAHYTSHSAFAIVDHLLKTDRV